MFTLKRKEPKPSVLDPVIETLISAMAGVEEGSDEYTKMVRNLRELIEAKAAEKPEDKVSANQRAAVVGNLIGIAMILVFERKNVITGKGLNFIPKLHN